MVVIENRSERELQFWRQPTEAEKELGGIDLTRRLVRFARPLYRDRTIANSAVTPTVTSVTDDIFAEMKADKIAAAWLNAGQLVVVSQ